MADHPTPQLTDDDIAGMTAEEVAQALDDGRLDQLLGRPPAVDPHKAAYDLDDVRRMTPEQVDAARRAGQLDQLLKGDT